MKRETLRSYTTPGDTIVKGNFNALERTLERAGADQKPVR
jgi:hypothetical protein